MIQILTIGAATQDTIVEYAQENSRTMELEGAPHLAFRDGSKIEIDRLHHAVGGGATNSAVSFKRLGLESATFLKIGADSIGNFILDNLKKQGITVYHTMCQQELSGSSFIVPSPRKDRVVFTHRGANKTIQEKDLPQDIFNQIDALYITSLTGKAAHILPHITHLAQQKIMKKGLKIAVNPGTSQMTENITPLKAALSYIDVLMMNSYEMKLLMESLKPRFFKSSGSGTIAQGPPLARSIIAQNTITFTLREYLQEICSYGVKRVVVTDGKLGVYVATKDQLFYHPAISSEVVNTVGAGDAFNSSLFAQLLKGRCLEDAIRCAALNASSVIMHQDAQSGLLTQDELDRYKETIDRNLLQTYPLF